MAFEQAFSQHLKNNGSGRGEAEPRKKLRKRRSIRFSNGSWFSRISSKPSKSQINGAPEETPAASKTSAAVQQPSLVALSDSSPPNYMKSTSCFDAKRENSHEEIDFDDVNSLISSSCGSSDIVVLPSTVMSDDAAIHRHPSSSEISDASPQSLKENTYSEERKFHDSESSCDSSDNGKSSNYALSKSVHSGHRALPALSRSSTKRAVRIFIKKNSFNPRRTPPLKSSKMSEDVNVERATCSSIIKDSRFPDHVELEHGLTESERTSFVKVCPYHHCSLNGHCHDPPPPKKPFLRSRRQSTEPWKVKKSSSVSAPETKRSADMKKGSKKHKMGSDAELFIHEASLLESEKNDQEFREAERNSFAREEGSPEATSELRETSLELHSPKAEVQESKASALSLGVQKTQPSKGKPISMWHLIHKHMVSGIAAEEETKPHQGTDERTQVEGAKMATASSNVSPDLPDSDVGTSNHDNVDQDIEIQKLFAIKLVREAIEQILLPEVQDQLSESQSVTSQSVEGQELTEMNHQEAPDEGCKRESDTMQVHIDGSLTAQDVKKPETQLGKKSDKKSPSNWSNLKKWVLLQRFVKELEKVRKINYSKPRQLQLETDPYAEKVSLRRQTTDEKKKAEEWMLDYALQQVVSQLAPTQRRKVALLVKAFETVVPPQEDGVQVTAKAKGMIMQEEDRNLKADKVTPKRDDLECSVCIEHSETEKPHMPVINEVQLPADLCSKSDNQRNASSTDAAANFKTEYFDGGSESSSRNEDINVASERSFAFPTKSCDVEMNSAGEKLTAKDENIAVDSSKKTLLEQHRYANLKPSSEHSSEDSGLSTNERELGDVNCRVDETLNTLVVDKIEKTGTTENLVHSTLKPEASTWMETKIETMPEPGVVQVFPPQVMKTVSKENEESQSPLDKQNYLSMWHLVCQHVVSSVATKLVLDEDDEETEEANKSSAVETLRESPEERHKKAEFSRSQVLKLVKEAVQEILNPEIQDESSDTLSTSSENFPDPQRSEKDHNEGAKQSISNSDGVTEQNTGELDRSIRGGSSLGKEKELTNGAITTQDSKNAESMNKSINDPPKPKNWRKLKKLILLKRSIKAMEKARKVKFPPQQLLPPPSDQEPEKVDLRHQMMDERRKAEQWMLDYAVQHIVTKLTPARTKRVAMLVEAFEAVVPLPGI